MGMIITSFLIERQNLGVLIPRGSSEEIMVLMKNILVKDEKWGSRSCVVKNWPLKQMKFFF